MTVEIFDVSNYLKNAFAGRVVNVPRDGGVQTVDGGYIFWFRVELFFGDVNGQPIDVTYGATKPSTLPAKIQIENHLLFNCRDIEETRKYTFSSSYTESTTVSKSKTLVEGRSVTLKADGGFNFKIVKVSAGISTTETVSLTNMESTSVVRNDTKTETFPFEEKVPARTYREIQLRRELANYETEFEATLIIDGRVLLQVERADKVEPRIDCGSISDYLSVPERTIKVSGLISNIVGGSLTFGSGPDRPISDRPELCGTSGYNKNLKIGVSDFGLEVVNADLQVLGIENIDGGGWQATFEVSVSCSASSCAGFDVTLNFADGQQQLVSVDGWNIAESTGGSFQIVRGTNAGGDEEVTSISVMNPVVAICDDD